MQTRVGEVAGHHVCPVPIVQQEQGVEAAAFHRYGGEETDLVAGLETQTWNGTRSTEGQVQTEKTSPYQASRAPETLEPWRPSLTCTL